MMDDVFERFTDGAREVVVLAQDEARGLGHNYIGTEHLLLGMLRDEAGAAARVLGAFDITLEETRAAVERIVGRGDDVATGEVPFTPRAKKVLELSKREALSMGNNYIGTEHLLLGVVREGEGVATRILFDAGAESDEIRHLVTHSARTPGYLQNPGSDSRRADPTATGRAQLRIACPACAAPVEVILRSGDRPSNEVLSLQSTGARTCSRCGRRWHLDYSIRWEPETAEPDPSSEAGPG